MPFDLSSLGWDDGFASAYARFAAPDRHAARVIRVDRGVCSVLGFDGPGRASVAGTLLPAAFHDPLALPATGDWVVVRAWPDHRDTIEAILPRRTAIIRATAGRQSYGQVLVANATSVAVVAAVDPDPDLARVERLLSVAHQSGAAPIVVLTKTDLVRRPAALIADVSAVAPGVPVFALSATRGDGLDRLRSYVACGQTLALIGASGAGKSTLVNALAGADVMATQAIRGADGRGRHTTAYRALVPLPTGGAIVDTPGLRGVGVFDGPDGIDLAFADLDAVARDCRFADCTHEAEPGCAIVAALADGTIVPRRVANWRALRREVAHESARRDARATRQRRGARWLVERGTGL
jgi:ribosome biogenesis GTPase